MKKKIQSKKPVECKNSVLIEALSKISDALVSDSYLDDILILIVNAAADAMNSKICSIMLVDKSRRELEVKAHQAVSKHYDKKPNIKIGEGIAGLVAQTGKTITVSDVKKDERYMNVNIAKNDKLCSLLSVPIIFKGNIIGVLNSYTSKIHKFTKTEIATLKSIANQAAIVIENFKLVRESKIIKEELQTRKVIEKAKGILMKRDKITEEEAFNKIRNYSMNNRKSMKEVCDAIILSENMKNKM